MPSNRFEEQLERLIRPQAEALGLTLWGLETSQSGRRALVRIYIDAEDGVTVDHCAKLSRQVGAVFDVEDVIHGAYVLEVSSPGLERRFYTPEQLTPYVGRSLTVKLLEPVEDTKTFRGVLEEVSGDRFTIMADDVRRSFEWPDVRKVKLVHEF